MIAKWNMKVRCRRTPGLACAVALLTASIAVEVRADLTFGFNNITNNDPGDAAIGEAQLFVTVSDFGPGQVLFAFVNVGPLASSITDVYFDNGILDDGSLAGIAGLIDLDDGMDGDPDVDFSQYASPPSLPGGESLASPFDVTAGFLADSDPPRSKNGVNPGEWLGVVFDLVAGGTFANVIDELNSADLRIGIHVQAFEGEGSESFVNPPTPIPAPGAVALGALGLGLVGWMKRRLG